MAVQLDLKCMPVHASTSPPLPPTSPSVSVLPSPGQELFTSLSAVFSQSRDPIHIHRPQIPPLISPPTLKKKSLPVFPAAHTYIHKHVFMEAKVLGQKGAGDKNQLEFKAEDCGCLAGGWTVSQPHTRFGITPLWHANQQTGRAALVQVWAGHRQRAGFWSGEVWYITSRLVGWHGSLGAGGAFLEKLLEHQYFKNLKSRLF